MKRPPTLKEMYNYFINPVNRETFHNTNIVGNSGILEYMDGWLQRRFPFWSIYDEQGTNLPHSNVGNDFWLDKAFVSKYGSYIYDPEFFISIAYGKTEWPDTTMSFIPVFDAPTIENYIDNFMVEVEALSLRNQYKYQTLYESVLQEYDLLTDGSGKSVEQWGGSYIETRTPNITNKTTKDPVENKSDIVNALSAMDSTTYQPNQKQTIKDNMGNVVVTNIESGNEVVEHNENDRKKIISGNVSLSIPDLISKQREIAMFSLYGVIFEDIANEILEFRRGMI